jgi:hypothetical protein
MHEAKEEVYRKKALAICKALEKRNIKGIYVETIEKASDEVFKLIAQGATVGRGGSVTLNECGIIEALRSGDYKLIDRYKKGLSKEEMTKLYVEALSADVFLSSTNAITQDGKLINIDGRGNRVAALMYGPKKVIIVTGTNKIVEDVEGGIRRIKLWASPFNCVRLNLNTPCARTGICNDLACTQPDRICNEVSIIEGQRESDRMTVIIVGQELGF